MLAARTCRFRAKKTENIQMFHSHVEFRSYRKLDAVIVNDNFIIVASERKNEMKQGIAVRMYFKCKDVSTVE